MSFTIVRILETHYICCNVGFSPTLQKRSHQDPSTINKLLNCFVLWWVPIVQRSDCLFISLCFQRHLGLIPPHPSSRCILNKPPVQVFNRLFRLFLARNCVWFGKCRQGNMHLWRGESADIPLPVIDTKDESRSHRPCCRGNLKPWE